jgi:O-antigen/teichoic acid export membrane protein
LPVAARLLKVGSMAESLGVYVPAMILQKGLGVVRVLLFMWLMSQAEYGLWGVGLMIFLIAAPVATLGANHGLTRYVSLYEARGHLAAFYRRIRGRCIVAAVAVTVVGIAASGWITEGVIVSKTAASGAVFTYRYQLYVCLAALVNVLAGALYYDLLSFMFGMRAYRLASAAELIFSVVFTGAGAAALVLWPNALALLGGHFLAQATVIVFGVIMLQTAMKRAEGYTSTEEDWEPADASAAVGEAAVPPSDALGRIEGEDLSRAFGRVLRFGFVAMIGNILWLVAQYVSFYLTNRQCGKEEAGVFNAFLQLSQVVLLISTSAFAVVFAHTARRWEAFSRQAAMATLETSYKAITLAMMALTILIYATSAVWVRALRPEYYVGLKLLGGLLMFFQAVSNFSLLTAVARLRERPIVIAFGALAGGVANVVLAVWWAPHFAYGPAGAAWAAGVGMLIGSLAVTLVYFLAAGVRIHLGTWLLMVCPVLLLLPAWAMGALWAAVIVAAIATPLLFDAQEKQVLLYVIRQPLVWLKRKRRQP